MRTSSTGTYRHSVRHVLAVLAATALLAAGHAAVARALPDFTSLVKKNRPAVVNISTSQKVQQRMIPDGLENLPKDSPFYEFYRRFFEGREPPPERDVNSLGSGFIISDDGYVITNNHVIKDADEIIVRLSDRREFEAKLVGADERSDVALLKIDAEDDLPVVTLGTNYELEVGEWVLAIGSPFGFDHSVTAGIVSAKGRSLPRENYVPFIQTDVAINPGNSGGPLFNLSGQVIGVNAQIYTRTGAFNGLSFAIPIDVAMDVVDQLRTRGRVSRGWLGVLIQDVTRELAESFGMEKPAGALIAKVLEDSPADRAGFQVGDIVLAFNGQEVKRSSDLPPIVGRTRVDTRTPVKILRDGRSRTLEVVIAELPEEDEIRVATRGEPGTVRENKLGVVVSDLTAEQRDKLEVEENGVVVAGIKDGPAKEGGIREGDVILMLNNERVKDAEHFKKLAGELPSGKAVSILVQRQGNPIFLALKTEK